MVASTLVRGGSGKPSLSPEGMTSTPRNPLAGTVYETETLRGVRCVRLSVLTDETTSPERQREADDIPAAALGIDFGEGDQLRPGSTLYACPSHAVALGAGPTPEDELHAP